MPGTIIMKEILKIKDFSFHRFPKHKHLQNTWILACKHSDDFWIDYARVCSDHFGEDEFECDLRAELLLLKCIKHLKPAAVLHIRIPSVSFSNNGGRLTEAQKRESQKNNRKPSQGSEGERK